MKILVTGGAGFIGGHTTEYLLREGHEIVIIDSMNEYYDRNIKFETLKILKGVQHGKLKIVEGNLQEVELLEKLFKEHEFEIVLHLAAQAGVRHSILFPCDVVKENVLSTINLLESARKYNIRHFILASSSSVYGKSAICPFDESQICNKPVSQYAASKRSCELFAYTYHSLYKIPITCLRFFTVYGPRGRPDMACLKFIDGIYKGIAIDKYGEGFARREFTYISDIVKGVIAAINAPNNFQIINLGGGATHTLNELIESIEKHLGKKAIINQIDEQLGDVPYTCADQTLARSVLNFVPSVSFDEGIKNTVDWYLKYVKSPHSSD